MIIITEKYRCCGCEACVQICPKHCISFYEDTEGFCYPVVNKEQCVDCSMCEKVCPVVNQGEKRKPIKSFAAFNTNEEERLKSSSGGIFILLAEKIIESGGVVFGARFDDNWNVVHSYAETHDGVKPFMGSKYVQSRIGGSYIKTREFLQKGRKVLFSGTPCQIAGLRRFLCREYENLLTVDLVCHGVPSPAVWRQYLTEIKENARNDENFVSFPPVHSISECDDLTYDGDVDIESIAFRDKRLGWKKYSFAFTLAKETADDKKNTVSFSHIHENDPYFLGFNNYSLFLRPSCYSCPVRELRSGSDLTIADFWGIDSLYPEIDDDKGVSAVIVKSEKGRCAFSTLNVERKEVRYKDIEERNKAIFKNPIPPSSTIVDLIKYGIRFPTKRDYFFYNRNGSVSMKVLQLCSPNIKARAKYLFAKIFRRFMPVSQKDII